MSANMIDTFQGHEDHLNRLRRRIDELEKENTELVDDKGLLDYLTDNDHVHIAPYLMGSISPGWSVHHTGRHRIYNGTTPRIALSNCILDLEAHVPHYVYAKHAHATEEDLKDPCMSEQEAKTKGFI